jgi:hypothetical protein
MSANTNITDLQTSMPSEDGRCQCCVQSAFVRVYGACIPSYKKGGERALYRLISFITQSFFRKRRETHRPTHIFFVTLFQQRGLQHRIAPKMSDVQTKIEFLVKDPRYTEERPYIYHPSINDESSADDPRLTNMSFDSRDVTIRDARATSASEVGLDVSGFTFVKHVSPNLGFLDEQCMDDYQRETEEVLRKELKAEAVLCCRSIVCY